MISATPAAPSYVLVDHPAYVRDRRARRAALLTIRRQVRRPGVYDWTWHHDAGRACCRREAPSITAQWIVAQLRLDGVWARAALVRGDSLAASALRSAGGAVGVVGGPVGESLGRIALAVAGGAIECCPHLGVGDEFRAVWLRDLDRARCAGCHAGRTRAIVGTPEGSTCDGCRRAAEVLRPFVMMAGPLTVFGDICERCSGGSRVTVIVE